jgi:hypothetical protein
MQDIYGSWGFHSDDDLDCDLLGYDIMQFVGGGGRNLTAPSASSIILCRFRYISNIYNYLMLRMYELLINFLVYIVNCNETKQYWLHLYAKTDYNSVQLDPKLS